MKRCYAIILLILHINFTMLIPQTNEIEEHDFNGRQSDDINSLVEYVDQEILENIDYTPEDEDDDKARNYGCVQFEYFNLFSTEAVTNHSFRSLRTTFAEQTGAKIPSISFDIAAPPPKA